jgi:transcriptional regulator with XRE-family HTH domain
MLKWHVGDVARKLRDNLGWSLLDMKKKSGLNMNTISAFERGVSNPKADTHLKIAAAFGVSVEELYAMVPVSVLDRDLLGQTSGIELPHSEPLVQAGEHATDSAASRVLKRSVPIEDLNADLGPLVAVFGRFVSKYRTPQQDQQSESTETGRRGNR